MGSESRIRQKRPSGLVEFSAYDQIRLYSSRYRLFPFLFEILQRFLAASHSMPVLISGRDRPSSIGF